MTKEEKIREAYGEHYEDIKFKISDDGWIGEEFISRSLFSDLEFHDLTNSMRPLELKGIEDYYSFVDVVGFEYYQVNKLGIVISKDRITTQKNGKKYHSKGKILKPQFDATNGYIVFGLRKEGKTTKMYLHRMLAEAFIHNPYLKETVNHKDGVKYNNSLQNLEWATYKENNNHAFDIGLQKRGKEHHFYGKTGNKCHNHKDYKNQIY